MQITHDIRLTLALRARAGTPEGFQGEEAFGAVAPPNG